MQIVALKYISVDNRRQEKGMKGEKAGEHITFSGWKQTGLHSPSP